MRQVRTHALYDGMLRAACVVSDLFGSGEASLSVA